MLMWILCVNYCKNTEHTTIRLTVFLGRTYCLGFLTIFSWNLWTRVTIQFICIQIIINNVNFTDIKQIANLPVFLIPVCFLMCLFETDQTTKIPRTDHILCFCCPWSFAFQPIVSLTSAPSLASAPFHLTSHITRFSPLQPQSLKTV